MIERRGLFRLFRPPGAIEVLGSPFGVRFVCPLEGTPLPLLRVTGSLLLHLSPREGGVDPWLVAVFDSERRCESEKAAKALLSESGEDPTRLVFVENLRGGRQPYETRIDYSYTLTSACNRALWNLVGNPHEDAVWLSARLTPRALSGAIRESPTHLQMWTRL